MLPSNSNLLKQFFRAESEEKRIIDNNERVRARLELLEKEQKGKESKGGFVSGIAVAEVLEAPADATGNVIKAQDEAKEILEQARAEAEAVLAKAQAEAQRIREEAQAQTNIERAQAVEQGRQQGYQDGMIRAQAQAQALEQEFQEKAQSLEEEYQQQIDLLEPNLVGAITGIYEHIFHVELSGYRDILTGLISDVLHGLEGSRSFLIHVSGEDYAYVGAQKMQLLAGFAENVSVDVVEDRSVARNECMIETENGIFDCGLGTQLSELKRKLTLLSWMGEA